MEVVITIILIIIIILGSLGILYMNKYNKMQEYIMRIKESEGIINESLRDKYDLLLKIIKNVKSKAKLEANYFKDLEKINYSNLNNYDFDRKLIDNEILIEEIKNDYPNIDNQNFKSLSKELRNINEKLKAAKLYYNSNTTELNKNIKAFPSNIVARIHKIKLSAFFDRIDLFDNNENDFKL